MTLTAEFDAELKQDIKQVHTVIETYYRDLVTTSPEDTGRFKRGWRWHETSELNSVIENMTPYSSILWLGRRTLPNKKGNMQEYGSVQNGWSISRDVGFAQFKHKLENLNA